jgi:hypothetical protein
MAELLYTLMVFLVIFVVVFVLNVVPIFAPPTWAVLSFIAIRYDSNIVILAIVGAVAATAGRLVLARLSNVLIRQKFLSKGTRQNIDAVRLRLESSTKLTMSMVVFYAFCPLPTNHLFIAYGLTALKLKLIAIPFLIGRVLAYSFVALTASSVARILASESLAGESLFSYYFLGSQVLGLLMIYAFARIDWQRVFSEKRLRWRRRS